MAMAMEKMWNAENKEKSFLKNATAFD